MAASHQSRSLPLGQLKRVAVFRALQLGDLLCAVPAFRALRCALPQAQITLIGLPWAAAFTERFRRYFDRFIEFPGYPGLVEQPPRLHEFFTFLRSIQSEQFDLAVQMHGNGAITNPLVALFAARHTAGFFQPDGYCPDPNYFMPYPAGEPEIWRHLRLMNFLGIPHRGARLEFPLDERDWRELEGIDGVS